ncbi:hypothetical protein BJY52DRAFT_1187559 [Lactarius psammicola]|nr:hypothetical protein BJY52DRAFT_1187559 [Lactarius psammicola]
MPARKQAKKGTKPTHKDIEPKWPGDVSDDADYDSGLESDSSGSSFDRESIASGDLHVVARKGVVTNDEEGGGAGDARDSITPSNPDLVAQEGVAANDEEGGSAGDARGSITPSNLDLVAQEGVTADEEEGDVTGEMNKLV